MKAVWSGALCAVLSWTTAAEAGICGSNDDSLAMLGHTANMAAMFCPGVDEISDRDLGLLLGASAVDPRKPACAAELGDLMLMTKAQFEKDREGWCAGAKLIMSGHPKTEKLVRSGQACSEIDNVSGILETVEQRCLEYRITRNGRAALELKSMNPGCHAQRVAANGEKITELARTLKKTEANAAKVWCDSTYSSHKAQMDALGMQFWFEPK